jgi:hypothetical protein
VKERERVLALFLLVIIEAIFEPIDLSLSLSLSLSVSFFLIFHKEDSPARRRSTIYYTHDAVQYREFIPISLSLL